MRTWHNRLVLGLICFGSIFIVGGIGYVKSQGAGNYAVFAPLVSRNVTPFPADYVGIGLIGYDNATEIYAFRADGSDVSQLTDNEWEERNPTLSPDGDKIAFWQRASGTPNILPEMGQVMVINRDGSGLQALGTPRNFSDQSAIQWSPDGNYILAGAGPFLSYIYSLINVTDGSEIVFDQEQHQNWFALTWSPDGRYFHYVDSEGDNQGWRLWIYHMKSGVKIELGSVLQYPDYVTPRVLWHPHHAELLYNSAEGNVVAVQPDGTHPRIVATSGYLAKDWLNGGETILFYRFDPTTGVITLHTMPFMGGDMTPFPVAHALNNGAHLAAISPKGDAIIYSTDSTAPRMPVVYHPIGGEPIMLTECRNESCFVTQNANWSADGTSFTFRSTQHNGQHYEREVVYVRLNTTPISVSILDESIGLPVFLPWSSTYAIATASEGEWQGLAVLNLPAGTHTPLVPELGTSLRVYGWWYVGSE